MAKILIADDDYASVELMTVVLEAEGHEVLNASNGHDAYDLTLSEKPDLVFLDVMMPIFNGLEACQMIREDPQIPKELPVVFLTSTELDSRQIASVGANTILPKTHMITELRDLLVQCLGPKAVTD